MLLDRYAFVRWLGAGGMGAVALVYDAVRAEHVALKRVRCSEPDAMRRLKAEFRVLAGLQHPNLVRVYDLGSDAEGLYFTMQAIEGTDLKTFCRGGSTSLDLRVLSQALAQICNALAYLHDRGIVHGDLKPQNILVAEGGKVTLLDFGLLAEIDRATERGKTIAGTLGYMSPELLCGDPPARASDAYALGATLFEVIAGRAVFEGPPEQVRRAHMSSQLPSLLALMAQVPSAPGGVDLARTVEGLLDKDPMRRLEMLDSLDLLGSSEPTTTDAARPNARSLTAATLVGRDELVGEVVANLDVESASGVLVLSGATGVGKTALAAAAVHRILAKGICVFNSRARQSELLPYNALDGAIDELSRTPVSTDGEELQIRGAAARAASAFPVLAALGGLDLERERTRDRVMRGLFGKTTAAAPVSRGTAFQGLAEVVAALCKRAQTIFFIDDFQWADLDSLAALEHLLRARIAGFRVLATVRNDIGETVATQWLDRLENRALVQVPPLAEDAISAIIRKTAAQDGAQPSEATVVAAARACLGRPMLAELSGRALARGFSPAGQTALLLSGRILDANPLERTLLGLLAAGDGWTDERALLELSEGSRGAVEDALRLLEHDRVLRRSWTWESEGRTDFYHDAIREAALAALDPALLVDAHSKFADLHARAPLGLPRRVRHLLGARRFAEAGRIAPSAAAEAAQDRAYSLAAELYAVALEHGEGERPELLRQRADVLESAARYADAAQCWRRLVEIEVDDLRIDAAIHEAYALLASNQVSLGARRLESALALAGEPSPRARLALDLLAALRFVRGPRKGSDSAKRSPTARTHEPPHSPGVRDVKVGSMLTFFDPLAGLRFLLRARARFDATGAAEQAAWCDYVFAHFAQYGTDRPGLVPLSGRYRAAADARLVGLEVREPTLIAVHAMLDGVDAIRLGRWAEARQKLDTAAEIHERSGSIGTFEHMMILSFRSFMEFLTQDARALDAQLQHFLSAAASSGETAIVAHHYQVHTLLDVLLGRFAQAGQRMQDHLASLPVEPQTIQRHTASRFRFFPEVYGDDPAAARRGYAAALRAGFRYGLSHNMMAGAWAAYGGLLEANALRTGDRGASERRLRGFAKRVACTPPTFPGAPTRALAYAADVRGRPERAIALLEQAEAQARALEQPVDTAIARWQRGRRIGGDEGAALCSEAQQLIESRGASPALLQEDAGLR